MLPLRKRKWPNDLTKLPVIPTNIPEHHILRTLFIPINVRVLKHLVKVRTRDQALQLT